MRKGSTLISPSFLAVGTGVAKLSDWKPTNCDDYIYGDINFESLDSAGRSTDGTTFMYVDMGDGPIWVDGELNPSDKVFAPGEAVWMSLPEVPESDISPVGINDSGEVNKSEVLVTLRESSNAIGNFMATDYPISDIEVIGDVSEYIYGDINFESLDSSGRSVDGSTYMYVDMGDGPAWVDGELSPLSDTDVLHPGEGIWFSSPFEGMKLKFYAPDL